MLELWAWWGLLALEGGGVIAKLEIQDNRGWRHCQNILEEGKHFSSKALLQA